MQEHDFEASGSGACTAMCWRPQSEHLPPMILLGTEQGAKVRVFPLSCARLQPVAFSAWPPPGSLPPTINSCKGRTKPEAEARACHS